jgi:hypothetical protein
MNAIIIISDNFGGRENMKKTRIIASVLASILVGTSFIYINEYASNTIFAADLLDYEEYTEENLKYKIYADHVTVGRCDEKAIGEIIIPEKIKGIPVTEIGSECFRECKGITSIIIPDSVEAIGKRAFLLCFSLNSVNIPQNITVIESGVFNSCTSLKSITIPNSVTQIESTAFMGCESFISVVIPDSVKSIGVEAFLSCTHLSNITIPESVTSIELKAFANCPQLTIYGQKDSCAEKYANEYNHRFVDLSVAVPPSLGDPNGDGAINAIDASEMLTVYTKIATNKTKPTSNELAYCDVDKNGAVNAVDASYVLSFYAYNATSKTKISFTDYMKKK